MIMLQGARMLPFVKLRCIKAFILIKIKCKKIKVVCVTIPGSTAVT